MHSTNWLVILLVSGLAQTGPAQVNRRQTPSSTPGAYLFAHMTKQDYGRLYYSISEDGLHWTFLNDGKRILGDEYRGHPDITRGHDGRYYLIGNYERRPEINLWVSHDLVTWSKFGSFEPDLWKTPNFTPALHYIGAPKIFYDKPSAQYVITWHSTVEKPIKEDTEQFWRGMRTLYVTSQDLEHFSDPKRFFPWNFPFQKISPKIHTYPYHKKAKFSRILSLAEPAESTEGFLFFHSPLTRLRPHVSRYKRPPGPKERAV